MTNISIGAVGVATPVSNSNFNMVTGAVTTAAAGSGFVIALVSSTGTTDTPTCTATDSFGNAYTKATELVYLSGGARYSFNRWYIAPGAAGYVGGGAGHIATIAQVDPVNDSDMWMALIEMPGAALSNAAFYGSVASHQYPFSHAPPYASASLAVAPPATGAILLSCLACQQPGTGVTGTESTGFTVETTSQLRTINLGAIGVRAVTASSTYTPSWSASTTTGLVEAFSSIDSFFGASSALQESSLSSMSLGPG